MSTPLSSSRTDHARDTRESLFAGSGEMKGRCRNFDWASSELGPVDAWPACMRVMVSSIMDSGFPNIVLYGPELIQIYNDAYREIMGTKHPAGLGMRTRECWPEAWEFNEPIYRDVFNGGSKFFEDTLIPLSRYGVIEDAYFTVSYSPIRDESTAIAGVLVTLLETTSRVAARRLEVEREKLLRQVNLERNRLDEIFRQSPGFFAVLRGPNHVFERANDAYFQVVGNRDIIGKPVVEALPEVVEQGFIGLLDSVMRTGESFVGSAVPIMLTRTPNAKPEQRYVNFVYAAMHEEDGSYAGIVAHGWDVTDQVEARKLTEELLKQSEVSRLELEEQTRLAHEANRAKSEFLATMSHELRTPLNAISGYADLLLSNVRGEMSNLQRSDVQRIQRSGQHLLGLINTLLNFTKIDAGDIAYDMQPWSLRLVLGGIKELILPQIAAKSLKFTTDLCDTDTKVLVDADKVTQILLNLLTNAVKFTPEGGSITLSCDNRGPRARIRVMDTGRGIARENIQRIFDPFVQLDRHLTPERQQGVGLGLAISRDLARAMNGDLVVESELGKGSTFSLLLARAE